MGGKMHLTVLSSFCVVDEEIDDDIQGRPLYTRFSARTLIGCPLKLVMRIKGFMSAEAAMILADTVRPSREKPAGRTEFPAEKVQTFGHSIGFMGAWAL